MCKGGRAERAKRGEERCRQPPPTCVPAAAINRHALHTPTNLCILLEERHIKASTGKAASGRKASRSATNDDGLSCGSHNQPLRVIHELISFMKNCTFPCNER